MTRTRPSHPRRLPTDLRPDEEAPVPEPRAPADGAVEALEPADIEPLPEQDNGRVDWRDALGRWNI